MKLKTIIIDDDPLSIQILEELVKKQDRLELCQSFSSPISAISYLTEYSVDLIFLDIQMPEMTGLEFISILKNTLPQVIITSSHSDFAVAAFEYNISGYLLKPIQNISFIKAVNKVVEASSAPGFTKIDNHFIFIKAGKAIIKLNLDDILYLESLGDYATICTEKNKHTAHITMKSLEDNLNSSKFIRVHRSFIINKAKIDKIVDDCIIIGDKTIPIGKTYKSEVFQSLNIL